MRRPQLFTSALGLVAGLAIGGLFASPAIGGTLGALVGAALGAHRSRD